MTFNYCFIQGATAGIRLRKRGCDYGRYRDGNKYNCRRAE